MIARSPNLKQHSQTKRPPLKISVSEYRSLKPYSSSTKKAKPKMNIKLGKCKLPLDFFSSNALTNKAARGTKKIASNREDSLFFNENGTPKFKDNSNNTSFFRSTRTLRNNVDFVSPSITQITSVDMYEIDRPLRELSTQLRRIRQYSSRKFMDDGNRVEKVSTHRSKLQAHCRSDWENPQRLPPLKLGESLKKIFSNLG